MFDQVPIYTEEEAKRKVEEYLAAGEYVVWYCPLAQRTCAKQCISLVKPRMVNTASASLIKSDVRKDWVVYPYYCEWLSSLGD